MTARLQAGLRLRRLLAVLSWLAEKGGAPIAEVADRFGMAEDEVVAELELAACCGLPPYTPDQLMELMVGDDWVEANLGPHLSAPARFSAAEGFTVAAAARAILAVPGADESGVLAAALAKLEAALGERQRLAVELDDPPLLATVRAAAAGAERLRIAYYSASRDEVTEREVEPYGVFSHAGHWYLDAHCRRAGGLRHFRVDRIESAEPTGDHFERPVWSAPDEVFEPGPELPVATLLLPASARWLTEAYPTESVDEEPDGRLRVRLAVGGRPWLARLLLQAGPGAEVVDPPELADAGREAARAVLARYGV